MSSFLRHVRHSRMIKNDRILKTILALGVLATAHDASAAEFIPLGTDIVRIGSVSPDGLWVTGSRELPQSEQPECPPWADCGKATVAFRWSKNTGVEFVREIRRGTAIAGDGTRIVGPVGYGVGPVAWFEDQGFVDLGVVEGLADRGYATALSSDGTVAVGAVGDDLFGVGLGGEYQAFRWRDGSGIESLGDLPGATVRSFATAVSADGRVIVGQGTSSGDVGGEAFRWTEETGMVGLGHLDSRIMNTATDVSDDGQVVVGYAYGLLLDPVAFQWTEDSQMTELGFEVAQAVNADGSTIVGQSNGVAMIWDDELGVRRLQDVLAMEYGLSENLVGWSLEAAMDISADGETIIGFGENPHGLREAWIFVENEAGGGIRLEDVDFDSDNQLTVMDINVLMSEIARGSQDPKFDLDSDGLVDDVDRDTWLAVAGPTNGFAGPFLVGDANLDGSVNSSDLNALAVLWQSDNNDWSRGNFTEGGNDSADLNQLALNWQQSISGASGVNAPVPEPSALLLTVVGLALVWRRSRCR